MAVYWLVAAGIQFLLGALVFTDPLAVGICYGAGTMFLTLGAWELMKEKL